MRPKLRIRTEKSPSHQVSPTWFKRPIRRSPSIESPEVPSRNVVLAQHFFRSIEVPDSTRHAMGSRLGKS